MLKGGGRAVKYRANVGVGRKLFGWGTGQMRAREGRRAGDEEQSFQWWFNLIV